MQPAAVSSIVQCSYHQVERDDDDGRPIGLARGIIKWAVIAS